MTKQISVALAAILLMSTSASALTFSSYTSGAHEDGPESRAPYGDGDTVERSEIQRMIDRLRAAAKTKREKLEESVVEVETFDDEDGALSGGAFASATDAGETDEGTENEGPALTSDEEDTTSEVEPVREPLISTVTPTVPTTNLAQALIDTQTQQVVVAEAQVTSTPIPAGGLMLLSTVVGLVALRRKKTA